MCQGIAHFLGDAPWHGGVLPGKVGVILVNVVARLANHFKVTNHGVLCLAVRHELGEVRTCGIDLNVVYGFQDVPQLVGTAQRVCATHTATASRST